MFLQIRTLTRSIACIALLSMTYAAAEALNSTIDAPPRHTARTLDFFERSGYVLETLTTRARKYILESQKKPVVIYLDRYPKNKTLAPLVQGIKFDDFTITSSHSPDGCPEALNKNVLENLFRAFEAIRADEFTIDGVVDVMDSEEPMEVEEPKLTCATQFRAQARRKRTYSDLAQEKTRLLSLSVKRLCLKNMSNESAAWVLSHIDLSDTAPSLCIIDSPLITTLECLDRSNPGKLTNLHIFNLENLASINCALLENSQVLNSFGVWGPHEPLQGSKEVLRAIGSHQWDRLDLPAELWVLIARQAQESFMVENLSLNGNSIESTDPFWEESYQIRPSVASLHLALASTCTYLRLPDGPIIMLKWLSKCFANIEEVVLTPGEASVWTPNGQQYVSSAKVRLLCMYVEPICPTLKAFSYEPTTTLKVTLLSLNRILWVAPSVYLQWSRGQLDTLIINTCKEAVYTINNQDPPQVLPTLGTYVDTGCIGCHCLLDTLSQQMQKESNINYVAIVCNRGHMICYACLKSLAVAELKTNKPIHCLCGERIEGGGFYGTVSSDEHGNPVFKVSLGVPSA
ncbi:hypothetical protein NEDG_00886 [Nematocida displodere]|uniref:RING-type domain-containing protein n=1 Tax=Nematocida displodere TaxID=1805483 RepID=A0A177ECS1_9MICR|nr:hypothetical protein NEDG_00886 [Nematocida displodere]